MLSSSGPKPEIMNPGTISACSKHSESSRVAALIGIMQELRVRADVVSYNSIISGHLGHVSAWQSTFKVLDNLTLEHRRIEHVGVVMTSPRF